MMKYSLKSRKVHVTEFQLVAFPFAFNDFCFGRCLLTPNPVYLRITPFIFIIETQSTCITTKGQVCTSDMSNASKYTVNCQYGVLEMRTTTYANNSPFLRFMHFVEGQCTKRSHGTP